jgi:hypothetical protein
MTGYDEYYAFDVEGNRVGLMTCLRCGAAVILDKTDAAAIHNLWHERQIATAEAASRGDRNTRRFN